MILHCGRGDLCDEKNADAPSFATRDYCGPRRFDPAAAHSALRRVIRQPGPRTREQIASVVAAVAPRPINVLVGWPSELTVAELAELGVRRISVGGALARTAWGGFMRAAKTLAEGRFDGFADAAAGSELDAFFGAGAGAARTRG